MTFSLVACDLEARQWGVTVASKFPAVGAVVPWAQGEVGAIATQSYANVTYGPDGLGLLASGLSAQQTVERLTGPTTSATTASWGSSMRRAAARRSAGRPAWTGRAGAPGPASPPRATS